MKNYSIAQAARAIPYNPSYRWLCGSVTATILFQQLEFRFSKYPDGFYKFLEPAPDHEKYKQGDSWTEELEYSKEEFRTSFDRLGIRYQSKTEFKAAQAAGTLFQRADGTLALYASYREKMTGLTYYIRNHEIVDSAIDRLQSGNLTKTAMPMPVNRECQLSILNRESQLTNGGNAYIEYKEHSESTTENTKQHPKKIRGRQSSIAGNTSDSELEIPPSAGRETAPVKSNSDSGSQQKLNQQRLAEIFDQHYQAVYNLPADNQKKDFVQAARLKIRLQDKLTEADFQQACKNYLATPQSKHTLAYLCGYFATFRLHALDKYGKPVENASQGQQTPNGETEKEIRANNGYTKNTTGVGRAMPIKYPLA